MIILPGIPDGSQGHHGSGRWPGQQGQFLSRSGKPPSTPTPRETSDAESISNVPPPCARRMPWQRQSIERHRASTVSRSRSRNSTRESQNSILNYFQVSQQILDCPSQRNSHSSQALSISHPDRDFDNTRPIDEQRDTLGGSNNRLETLHLSSQRYVQAEDDVEFIQQSSHNHQPIDADLTRELSPAPPTDIRLTPLVDWDHPHYSSTIGITQNPPRSNPPRSSIPGVDPGRVSNIPRRYGSLRYLHRSMSPDYWEHQQNRENERLEELRQQARSGRRRRPDARPRIPWSEQELKVLIRLWLKHGNHWTKIKEKDEKSNAPSLGQRIPTDLRDKIRNLKMWMIR
jgi:hypothetical protein